MSLKIGSQGGIQSPSQGPSQTSGSGKFGQILENKGTQAAQTKPGKVAGSQSTALEQFRALVNKGASPQELVRVALQNNPLFKNAPNLRAQVMQGVEGQIKDSPIFRKV